MKDPEERERMRRALAPDEQGSNGGIPDDPGFGKLVATPGYLEQAAAISAYTYHRNSMGIAEMLADQTIHSETATQLAKAEKKASRLRIATLRHVGEISLTSCLVGYTRGDYDPARVRLQLYVSGKGTGVSYVAYTNTVSTEGVYLQIDPTATLKWLAKSFEEKVPVGDDFSRDLFELQKRFNPQVTMFKGPDDPWSHRQYMLLHSASHLLIRALGKFSGLEQEGLTEKIYPYQNSIIVYSNQSTEFSLGGLAMAFEHHLDKILESMLSDAETCPYNPECETRYGACPACMYVAEISCENYNRVLDRRKLSPSRQEAFWH